MGRSDCAECDLRSERRHQPRLRETHFITGVTLGLKNTLRLRSRDDRARPGNLRTHHRDCIHLQIAELHCALPISFTIIDGYDALVTGGPSVQRRASHHRSHRRRAGLQRRARRGARRPGAAREVGAMTLVLVSSVR